MTQIDVDPRLLEILEDLPEDALKEIISDVDNYEQKLREEGPTNDDELWWWIKKELGVALPRKAILEGNQAPFQFVADLFFQRVGSCLLLAPRGGGKTLGAAIAHYLDCLFKPGYEGLTFGADLAQAAKGYEHLRRWILTDDGEKRNFIAGDPTATRTTWKNGSKVSIVPGSKKAVNGPHPNRAHADEVELMDDDVYREAQPVDTMIPTPTGLVPLGNLELGDYVFGSDGLPTQVIKINDLGEKDVYRVTLTDGRSTECCGGHLWTVRTGWGDRYVWRVKPTSELIEGGIKKKGYYHYWIPNGNAVEFDVDQDLPVDPYVLGVILGDGHIGRTEVSFRSEDSHIYDLVGERIGDGYKVTTYKKDKYWNHRLGRTTRSVPTTLSFLCELGLEGARSKTKFIPDSYKFTSRSNRIWLLRGLMDADGYVRNGTSIVEQKTISLQLAKDVREVVCSLGGRAILRPVKNNGKIQYSVAISFSDDTTVVSLPRKLEKLGRRSRTLHPSIKSIEPAGRKVVRCIGVDNADQTYRTTDYIVTHNSRFMPVSGVDKNGNPLPAQHVLTSTRKGPRGRMQQLMDEIAEAQRTGLVPPLTLYRYSVWEVSQKVSNCQVGINVDPAKCECGGSDPNCTKHCNCHRVQSGYWDREASKPRLLRDVCGGKLLRCEGWREKADIDTTFALSTKDDWEAQQECLKPATHLLYLPDWSEELHTLREYQPRPENGPIYQGIDWGFANPHAVLWSQLLTQDAPAVDHFGNKVMIKEGTLVIFDEIYKSQISDRQLADLIVAKEAWYKQIYGPEWRVVPNGRFPDPANPSGRMEFSSHEPPLPTTFKATREFLQHVRYYVGLFEEDRYRVVKRCENHIAEIGTWTRNEKKPIDPRTGEHPELEEFNHSMAAGRYLIANLHVIERRRMMRGANGAAPARAQGASQQPRGPEPDVPINPVRVIQRRQNMANNPRYPMFGSPVTTRP
jgi:hypothetical protein